MKKNLIKFLFGESQVDDEIASLVEDIADMDTEGATTLKVDKAPLAKALKSIGIEGGELEADPRGLSLVFSDGNLFRAAHALLNEPDAMHTLASDGWVYSLQGDVAQNYEPAEFRIRFLEIDNIEPENPEPDKNASHSERVGKVEKILKAGREFAIKKPEHDEEMNPVEFDDKTSSNRHKGVGDAKDGADPEGKPKGVSEAWPRKQRPLRRYKSEPEELVDPTTNVPVKMAKDLPKITKAIRGAQVAKGVDEAKYRRVKCDSCEALVINGVATHEHGCPNSRKPWVPSEDDERLVPGERSDDDDMDESLQEGGHKAGCQCGFCKNKGSFGKKAKEEAKPEGWADDDSEEAADESLSSPAEIVDKLLTEKNPGNPGTQPGILGTKSFSTMKVPGGHKDRAFKPAVGMVQPDNEIVNQQAKRKVNRGK